MEAVDWRRYLKLSLTEGALATAMGTLVSGVFLTGFALALGANRFLIGLLAALPPLAQMAQIAGSYWLERHGRRKELCLFALTAGRLLWIPLILAALVLPPESYGILAVALVVLIAASSVFSSLAGVAWLSWAKDLVPGQDRLGFLGLRNQFNTVLALLLSVLGAVFLDYCNRQYPGTINGFLIVFSFAVFCGLLGVPLLKAIPDPAASRSELPSVRSMFRVPLADGNYRRLLSFYLCWNLAGNLAQPFFAVYLLERLALPYWQVMSLYTLSSVVGLAANRFWMRLGSRFGTRPVVLLASIGEACFPLWWVFLSPETAWLLPVVFLSGVFTPPVSVGSTALVLKISPERNASPYLAVFNAIMGPTMAVASILGGWVAQSLLDFQWTAGPVSLTGLKVLFLIAFAGRLTSLLLLRTVEETDAVPVRQMLRQLVWAPSTADQPTSVSLPAAAPVAERAA